VPGSIDDRTHPARRCRWRGDTWLTALRVLVAALALVVVGGCGVAGASSWPARTPFPLPPDAAGVPLPTAAPAMPLPSGVSWACPAMLIGPVRIDWDPVSKTVSFTSLATGQAVGLVWPRGFSARLLGGRLEIVTPDGAVVGRDGDQVSSLGGLPDDLCDVSGTLYPPAS